MSQDEPKEPNKEQPRPWTADETVNGMKAAEPIIDKLADKWLKEILQYLKGKDKTERATNSLSSEHDLKLIKYSLTFLSVITGVLSVLAFYKVVSSDAVLYSFGALTGSVLTMMVKFRFWASEPVEEEVEG